MEEGPIIYLVDDDEAVLRSLGFLLSSLGHDYRQWRSPVDFLDDLATLKPGCVVTDLRMREISGSAMVAELRRRGVDWPVVLMTGDSGPALERRALAEGFAACLPKPVRTEILEEVLSTALAGLDESREKAP